MDAERAETRKTTEDVQDAATLAMSIVETIREPLLVLTSDLHVRMANKAFYRTFRVSPESTAGQYVYDLGNGQWSIPHLRDLLERILPEQNTFQDFEVEHEFPVIGKRTMLLNARQLDVGNEHARLILVAIEDVTERKQVERFREEYISIISHDLRNPLANVVGTASLLQRTLGRKGLEPEARQAGSVLTSARRMNSMIEDLVESARLESGKLELHYETIFLPELILDVTEHVSRPEDRNRLQVDLSDRVPLIRADRGRLERVITNLVSNALKYSSPDTPVLIHVGQDGDEVVISVSDQGVGIPAEELPQLFERYRRARTAGRTEGLGLGLYISRLIVEAHGGRIWVTSEVGRGSTFSFSLPLS